MKLILLGGLVVLLFLCGCGTVNFYQKLYADGSSDISLEVKSDNQMFLNFMKNGFENSTLFEKAVFTEEEGGYKYSINKVRYYDLATNGDNSIFSSVGMKKEFKFPYYYFTIKLKNSGIATTDSKTNPASIGMAVNYIFEPFGTITDTNGVYFGENKKAVKFNLMTSKEYYVTFRQNVLSAWLSGSSKFPDREAKETNLSSGGKGNALEPDFDSLRNTQSHNETENFSDTPVPDISDEDILALTEEEYNASAISLNLKKDMTDYISIEVLKIGIMTLKDFSSEKKYIRADIIVKNVGPDTLTYYSPDAVIIGKHNNQLDQAFISNYDYPGTFKTQNINRDIIKKGAIFFEITDPTDLDVKELIIKTGVSNYLAEYRHIPSGQAVVVNNEYVLKYNLSNVKLA